MSLTEKLDALQKTRTVPQSLYTWITTLSESDQVSAWKALRNDEIKTYPLFDIFREEGLRCAKDTFVSFRSRVLQGEINEENIHVA